MVDSSLNEYSLSGRIPVKMRLNFLNLSTGFPVTILMAVWLSAGKQAVPVSEKDLPGQRRHFFVLLIRLVYVFLISGFS